MADEWRVFLIVKRGAPDNTAHFLSDQLIHLLCLVAVSPLAVPDAPVAWIPEKWPVLGCLFILATHACVVFWYYIEKDMFDSPFPDPDEKWVTIAERFVFGACFLLPGPWGWVMPLVWAGVVGWAHEQLRLDFSWFSFYMGGVWAAGAGIVARVLWYA